MAKKSSGRSESTLHIAFGIGSFLLLLTTAYVFYQDHFGREFPIYQDMYRKFDLKRLADERKKANDELGEAEFAKKSKEYEESIKKNKAALEQQKPAVQKLKSEAAAVNNQLAATTIKLNFLKSNYDELKSRVDRGVEKDKSILVKKDAEIAATAAEQYNLKEQRDAKLAEAAAIEEVLAKSKREEDALFTNLNDYRSKMAKLKGDPIVNTMLDLPGLDFVAPRDKIDQVILNNLKWSVFFADAARVDRCVSCHKGIDNPDPAFANLGAETVSVEKGVETVTVYEKDKKVLKSHPRLDLFVGANSKHPYKKFGCTICHGGQPLATKFSAAAHSPKDSTQANYWRAQYEWESNENWDAKMLPLQHTEASCAKCHKNVDEVPEAAKLNEGRHLFRDRGCVNCHFGTSGASDMKWVGRVGPDLRRIGEKVSDINWARVWIENPWDFRPSTKMPRFFGLENHKDKAYEIEVNGKVHARDAVEAEAIATYLFTSSQLRENTPPPPKNGDVEEGRKLYASVGCVGCHTTHEVTDKDKYEFNQHGPDLSRIGEKVNAGWLYQWVKNPRHYWAETKMPNLRLSDDEAANLTSYLMSTMKVAKEERKPLDLHPTEAFDKILIEKLATTPEEIVRNRLKDPLAMVENSLKLKVKYATTLDEKGESKRYDTGDGEWTEGQIAKLKEILSKQKDPERAAKAFYTGETLIQHHGCYGCHNIQGWTYAPLTCVNLSGEADKDLDKFDFGKAGHDHSIDETKWDWFFAKISRPRVFDRDKEELIKPFDRLRMPWFGYTSKNNEDLPAEAPKEMAKEGAKHAEHNEHDEHHSGVKKYAPENNLDKSSTQVLGKQEIELLVTYLLSLTNEVIPAEMLRQPTPEDVALDHGKRVVRELNCTGCHMASIGSSVTNDGKATIPLAAFAALSTPKARAYLKTPGSGIYSDEDLVSLDYATNDAKMKGFLNLERGTYLNDATVPILFEEYKVRTNPLAEWEYLNFKIEKKGKGDEWKAYGELVKEADYIKLTELFYEPKYLKEAMKASWPKLTDEDIEKIDGNFDKLAQAIEEKYNYTHVQAVKQIQTKGKRDYAEAKESYAGLAKSFVNLKAYERLAGTEALKYPELKNEELKSQRRFYDPIEVKIRLTRGEGRIMNHIIAVEKDLYKNDNASQQQAPPSLSFEGGKIQPDWLYQFLHNVRPLRVGLNVRMPSFWTDGPYSNYKTIYPAGRLSAVEPGKRDKGAGGEPLPGPDSTKPSDIPDDAQQVVDFFVHDAGEKSYGSQPVLLDTPQKNLYEMGKRYVTELPPDDKHPNLVGIGCINCHSVGNFIQPIPKWAPNLANVKRRLKDDWLRRFITFPPSIYPWTNMPNNFINWSEYSHDLKDPTRGIADEAKMKEQAVKLEAVRFFLLHSGDGELGLDIKGTPPVPATPPAGAPAGTTAPGTPAGTPAPGTPATPPATGTPPATATPPKPATPATPAETK